MNDLSELEKELKKLRPTQPSPVLFERVGEALKDGRASAEADALQLDARLGAPGPQTSGTPYLFSTRVIRACHAVASRVGGQSVVAFFPEISVHSLLDPAFPRRVFGKPVPIVMDPRLDRALKVRA